MRDPAQSRIAREKFRHAFFIITLGDLNAFNPLPQLNRRVVIVDGKFSRLNRSVHLATQILARDFEPAQTLLFSAAMNGALRILAVDNEPSVTLSMRYIFAAPQYEFTRAENGLEALATLDRQCGSVRTIADTLEKWFLEGAADGFCVMPAWFPGAFDEFVDLVVPELQRRGLYRKAYAGTMLRDQLGLSRPAIGEYVGMVQRSKATAS